MIKLYQFYFSHYCEKTRWALDHKGIPFKAVNLLPGLHLSVTSKLAANTSVPIIDDSGRIIQGSAEITTYLDAQYPDQQLTPEDPAEARAALEWEAFLDQEIGPTLRVWFYYHALPDRQCGLSFLLEGAPWYGRPLFALIYPRVRAKMIDFMNINAASAAASQARFEAALDKLDAELEGKRFLVGDRFSRADLTACALLAPFCGVGRREADIASLYPDAVCAVRDAHKHRRYFKWVLDSYQHYR